MGIETAVINTTKQVILNVTNNIVNNPSNNDDPWHLHLILEILTAIGTIAIPIIIAILKKTYSRKQNQNMSMNSVVSTINSTPHKTAEENIYQKYKDGLLDDIQSGYNSGPASVVRRNYDDVGRMMHDDQLPRKQYFTMFGVLTIVSYFVLKKSIENERKSHGFHMAYFTNLAIDCFKFWDKQQDKPVITDPKGNPITREMLGEKLNMPKEKRWKL